MKSNKCFVDTSALIALNNPKDQYHDSSVQLASELKNKELIISDAVLSETHTLLRDRLGFQVDHFFLKTVLDDRLFKISDVPSLTRKTALKLLDQFLDQKISYCDALSVAIMKEQQIDEIFAFDHHFEIMGVKVVR